MNPIIKQMTTANNQKSQKKSAGNPMVQHAQSPSFNEFAKSMTPQGAYSQIQAMLESGQLTQDQLQQAISMAQTFMPTN